MDASKVTIILDGMAKLSGRVDSDLAKQEANRFDNNTAAKSEVSEYAQMVYVKHGDEKCSMFDMLSQQDPDSYALFGCPALQPEIRSGPMIAVTFGMIVQAIKSSANLFAHRIGTNGYTSMDKLNLDSSCPVIAYIAPAGIASALSFLVLGSQATLIPLSVNLSREEVSDSLRYVTDVVIVDEDILTPSFVEVVKDEHSKLKMTGSKVRLHSASSYHSADRTGPALELINTDTWLTVNLNNEDSKLSTMDEDSKLSTLDEDSKLSTPDYHVSREEDVVMLLRTSGTTGKSKLVPLLNGAVVANGMIIANSLGLVSKDVALNCMPLFHIGGLSANILAPLSVGGATICLPSFNAVEFVNILEDGRDAFISPAASENALPVRRRQPIICRTESFPMRRADSMRERLMQRKMSNDSADAGVSPGYARLNTSMVFSSPLSRGPSLSRQRSGFLIDNPIVNPGSSKNSRATLSRANSLRSQHNTHEASIKLSRKRRLLNKGGSDYTWVQPTWYHAVPTIHAAIVDYISSRGESDSSVGKHTLRFIRTGAANLPASVGTRLYELFGVNIVSTYSMTEQMPICQVPQGTDFLAKIGTVGKPVGSTLGIFDKTDGSLLPMMTKEALSNMAAQEPIVGEVCICGPFVTGGYVNNDEANASSFFDYHGKKFFKTGDVGYLDRQGFLFLTGRSKELIKRGGEQVSPFEVEEAVVKACPQIKTCLCFGVPSTLWGEQVGLVICMTSDDMYYKLIEKTKPQLTFWLKGLLKDMSDLHAAKYPEHVVMVRTEELLPKNAAGKFVRIGLAEKLNVTDSHIHEATKLEAHITVSNSFKGVIFILAFAVCWNHLYTSKAESDSARVWFFHEAMFFWIAGFSLSRSNESFETIGSFKTFYARTYAILLPLYWFSLLLCFIFFVAGCNPSNYVDTFVYGRQVTEPDGTSESNDSCQATPYPIGWGGSFVVSFIVYFLGLQTWIFVTPVSWFIHWYSWFFSVYFFQILLFPVLQNSMLPRYGPDGNTKLTAVEDSTKILSHVHTQFAFWMAMWASCTALMCLIFWVLRETYSIEVINWWVLGMYQLPLRWTPSFALGVAGWHYFRVTHADTARNAETIGLFTDFLSVCLLVGLILFWVVPEEVVIHSWAADDVTDFTLGVSYHELMASRFWQMFLAQMGTPLTCFWCYGMAVGRGYTAKIMAHDFVVTWLAPAGYGMFLFQQPIGQLYFVITRPGSIWLTPKIVLWFSPIPLPVPFWEFWPVVALTILFSIFVVPYITVLVTPITIAILSLTADEREDTGEFDGLAPDEIIKDVVEIVTGIKQVTLEMEFAFILGSMDAVLLIAELNHHSDLLGQVVRLEDVIASKTVGDLVGLVESRAIVKLGVLQDVAPVVDLLSTLSRNTSSSKNLSTK